MAFSFFGMKTIYWGGGGGMTDLLSRGKGKSTVYLEIEHKVNKVDSLSCRGRLSPNFFLYRVVDVSSHPQMVFIKVQFR